MKRIVIILTLMMGLNAMAQEHQAKTEKPTAQQRSETRAGNKAYKNKAYTDAEAAYKKATDTLQPYYKAEYNMGNALYRQKQYGRASEHYVKALQDPRIDKKQKSMAYHNLGNSQLQQGLANRQGEGEGMEQFQQAVNSYQEALKLNPHNQDTKYNLSYAKKMLAQAKQNQGGGGGGGQQNKDQKKDKKNADNNNNQQNKQNQQDQQKQNQQGQDNNQNNQHNQPQPKNQQQKDAEQLLNAVRNNERNTMREQQKKHESKVDGRIEKDW